MKIKISIQEVVKDFENICNIQGVIIGLKRENIIKNDVIIASINQSKLLLEKYKPNYKEYLPNDFETYSISFQNLYLQSMLKQQISEIIYKLV